MGLLRPLGGGFFGVILDGTGGVKIGTVFLKKLGSDLVVRSSREGYPEQNFALYHLGMVPGVWVFKGVRQGVFFYLCFLGFSAKSLQRVQKISRKASEIIEKSTETSAKQCISKEKFKQSLKVHTQSVRKV